MHSQRVLRNTADVAPRRAIRFGAIVRAATAPGRRSPVGQARFPAPALPSQRLRQHEASKDRESDQSEHRHTSLHSFGHLAIKG